VDQITLYIRESYNELVNKVTWPTWSELLASTRVVIVASVIIALIIFLMDLVSKQVLTIIYNMS
jgi:preprotein translocase subunit SecE